jgi:hypothetical protein
LTFPGSTVEVDFKQSFLEIAECAASDPSAISPEAGGTLHESSLHSIFAGDMIWSRNEVSGTSLPLEIQITAETSSFSRMDDWESETNRSGLGSFEEFSANCP